MRKDTNGLVRLGSVILGMIILASCGSPPEITKGTVVGREFEPAHEESYEDAETRTQCGMGINHKGEAVTSCQPVTYYVTRYRWVQDRWWVTISGCEYWEKKKKEHCDERTVQISERTYTKLEGAKTYNAKTGEINAET